MKVNLFSIQQNHFRSLLGLLLIGISLAFTSCKSSKAVVNNTQTQTVAVKQDKFVEISIKSIEALDLEEDLSFADEITLTYSLTLLDDNKKIMKAVNASWGVESIKKGEIIKGDKFKKLEIQVPEQGKLLSSVILMEIDDYQKAVSTVKKINELGGLAKIPATIINIAEYETPLAVVFASLQAAGYGLKIAEQYDKDDLLGQSSFELKLDSLSPTQKIYPVVLNFEGEHLKNTFRYKINYELKIR